MWSSGSQSVDTLELTQHCQDLSDLDESSRGLVVDLGRATSRNVALPLCYDKPAVLLLSVSFFSPHQTPGSIIQGYLHSSIPLNMAPCVTWQADVSLLPELAVSPLTVYVDDGHCLVTVDTSRRGSSHHCHPRV